MPISAQEISRNQFNWIGCRKPGPLVGARPKTLTDSPHKIRGFKVRKPQYLKSIQSAAHLRAFPQNHRHTAINTKILNVRISRLLGNGSWRFQRFVRSARMCSSKSAPEWQHYPIGLLSFVKRIAELIPMIWPNYHRVVG